MTQLSPEMKACIDNCLSCYATCFGMAMNHCLEAGGKHTEPAHFKLMMACAEICRTSPFHADRHAASQAYVPRVRGNLRAVRGRLRTGRRHGGLRGGLPSLRRDLPRDGGLTAPGREALVPSLLFRPLSSDRRARCGAPPAGPVATALQPTVGY